jgi:hypothetical protein
MGQREYIFSLIAHSKSHAKVDFSAREFYYTTLSLEHKELVIYCKQTLAPRK